MKTLKDLKRGVELLLFLSFLITACVNHIPGEEESAETRGDIPLKIAGNINEVVKARVSENNFVTGDEIGLFALVGSTTLTEERYSDNLRFVRSSEGEFVSEEPVYYPDDGVTLNLISYYPYRKEAVGMGETTMKVAVESNQADAENYSRSDFLIAHRENVSASKESISLIYNHQFFRLKITLAPGEGENQQELLATNPQLSVHGFYSKATYDFQTDDYTDYLEEKSLIPSGQWEIRNGKLTGKELILIPQKMSMGYQYLTLNVEGKTYSSFLPPTLRLTGGKQREIEVAFVTAEDILMSKVNGEIRDWEGTEIDHAESETIHKYIDISKLTFDESNVYRVLAAGKQVAEICKEYLVTPELSDQAIVAYPMKDELTVDLSQGTVVKWLGQSGKVHGGAVSWNLEDHSLKYTPGTLTARNNVYVLPDGKLSLTLAREDKPLSVLAIGDVLRDVRGSMIHSYPLVKIGTQYWMRSNLEASLYANGTVIPKLDKMAESAVGYLQSNKGIFYSMKSVLKHRLCPSKWSIPKQADWDVLNSYLKGNVSLLKAGTWIPVSEKENKVTDANNLSGFNGVPLGMYWGEHPISLFEGKYISYWTLNEEGTSTAEKVLLLRSDSNEMTQGKGGEDRAYAVRCLRK